MDIYEKLRGVKTMPELDSLRKEVVEAMHSGGKERFTEVQQAFISAKNRLRRIPLKDRTW